jgi:hypothetical protein
MKFKEYIILYMYRIAFSWVVATPLQICRNSFANLSQLLCKSVATPLQICRNSFANLSQLLCNCFAQFLTFSVFQRVKLLARGDVFGPNRSHSHSPIRGLHGEDLNSGGHGLTTLVRFYVARCDLGVICLFSPNPALSQCGEYWPVF